MFFHFPDCLGPKWVAISISILCIFVFIDYCKIARIWLKAAKRYHGDLLHNPWLLQSIIFVSCGVCGYLTIALSGLNLALAWILKLAMLIVLKIVNYFFIKSVAGKSFVVANEAELGRKVMFFAQQVEDGILKLEDAQTLLAQEHEGLEMLLKQRS